MKNPPIPPQVLSYIQEAYHKYYDSAFWMRDEVLMSERRKLLDEVGLTAQELYLETVLAYPSVEPMEDACLKVGLSSEVASLLSKMLSDKPEGFKLHLRMIVPRSAMSLLLPVLGRGKLKVSLYLFSQGSLTNVCISLLERRLNGGQELLLNQGVNGRGFDPELINKIWGCGHFCYIRPMP
jgi:hypothetical protein